MPLGFRTDRRRRQRQRLLSMTKWLLVFGAIAALCYKAYDMGQEWAGRDCTHRKDQIDTLTSRVHELEVLTAAQRAEMAESHATAQNWQALYERDVARGQAKELFELIQQKLAAGVEVERLMTVLTATQNRRDCRREGERRRFALPVREQDAPKSSLKFAKGEVAVVAFGVAATNEKGNRESWFDPAQPVTVRLIRGRSTVAEDTGQLPLTLTQIIGEREYQFTVAANRLRGTVDVTADSCRFP
jgi:hypothetical protein